VPIPNSKGNPFNGGVKYTGVGKFGDFRWKLSFISETARDRAIVTIERQYEVICALSHGDISNDLE